MANLVFSFVPRSSEEADDLESALEAANEGGVTIEADDRDGIGPGIVFAIVILGAAGLAAITRLADWLRDRDDCLLVVDARGEDVRIEERCDITGRKGQVIVVTGPDEQVVIHKPATGIVDLDGLVMAAIENSASAVAEAAKAFGASAELESPRSAL